ncbi:hypothetical protein LUZ60_013556 [Juncus effusus]|nr:hypothetical protein LUZ60_013556 [Juncus effusus]
MDQIILTDREDKLKWKWCKKDVFTTKSAYQKLSTGVFTHSDLKNIWKIKIPLRIQIFLWEQKQNRILTLDNLQKRGHHVANGCFLCRKDLETVLHISEGCDFVRCHWQLLRTAMNLEETLPLETSAMNNDILKEGSSQLNRQISSLSVFVIWRERCRRVFSSEKSSHGRLIEEIIEEIVSRE